MFTTIFNSIYNMYYHAGEVFANTSSSISGIVVMCIAILGLWKVFEKAGEPGWGALIPFYNAYLLFKISFGNGWFFLLMFIPIVHFVMSIILVIRLSRSFDKGGGFAVGLFFLFPIFLIILGLGSAQYIGPNGIQQ